MLLQVIAWGVGEGSRSSHNVPCPLPRRFVSCGRQRNLPRQSLRPGAVHALTEVLSCNNAIMRPTTLCPLPNFVRCARSYLGLANYTEIQRSVQLLVWEAACIISLIYCLNGEAKRKQ